MMQCVEICSKETIEFHFYFEGSFSQFSRLMSKIQQGFDENPMEAWQTVQTANNKGLNHLSKFQAASCINESYLMFD